MPRNRDSHSIDIPDESNSSYVSLTESNNHDSINNTNHRDHKRNDRNRLDSSTIKSLIKKKEDRSLYKNDMGPPTDADIAASASITAAAEKKSIKLTFKRLMSQSKPERSLIITGTICLFLAALLNLAIPSFVGTIIDAISIGDSGEASRANDFIYGFLISHGVADSPKAVLNITVILLIIIILLASLFTALRAYWFNLAGERVVARLRVQLFSHLAQFEIGFFDITRTGELINRLSSDTTILKDAVTVNISMALRWSSTVIVGIGYLFFISWKLTLVMLSVVPLVAIGARFYGKKIRTLSKATQDALADATTTAEESLSHIRTVRSFSRELYQSSLYASKINTTFLLGKRIAWLSSIFIGIISTVSLGAMILVLWYGATLVINGEMTTGVLTSYVLYTITIGVALAALSGLFASWMQALGACDRVFELLDRQPAIMDKAGITSSSSFSNSGGASLTQFIGHVEFDNVHFSYPARPDVEVLKGISFTLSPGSIVALVGPSGHGKSTVVSLIERWYDIVDDGEHGRILIDHIPIRDIPLKVLHKNIGLVSQEPVLFATTIRNNLLYGLRGDEDDEDSEVDISEAQIQQACEMANAWSFIQQFPDKLETLVGERGVRLSGGQKQRIAIARAILLNPRILIADEATSSLDADSEYHVQQALDRLMINRTVLIVAHRLSTVKSADAVLVIQQGQVVERGTHTELLKRSGVYAKLVARQLANDDDEEEEARTVDTSRASVQEEKEEQPV